MRGCLGYVLLAVAVGACGKSDASEERWGAASVAASASASGAASEGAAAAACPAIRFDLPPPLEIDGLDPAPVDVDDPHDALVRFFEKTARLLRGREKTPVRIAVYGDSNGTMDYMTGEMRRVLQTAHGDAGHGFVALAKPWSWYSHQDVVDEYDHAAWSAYTVTTHPTPALDPWYGPGLIVAQSHQTGARTWVDTAPDGAPVGTRASAFEIWYLAWPPGGAFDVKVDGQVRGGADTHAEGEPHFGFVRVEVPDGPHKMMVVTRDPHPVRLLGAVVERSEPGFQVDGLGVGSNNCLCVLRESEALDHEVLAHRPYDLVITHIGSNTWNPAVMDPVGCYDEMIARWRRAEPDVSVMMMTPPDWGGNGTRKTPGWLKKVETQLRTAADQSGVAFYDFRTAMGGEGSMAQFLAMDLTQGDGIHFNRKGAAFVADRLVSALSRAFAAWAERHPRAGCD